MTFQEVFDDFIYMQVTWAIVLILLEDLLIMLNVTVIEISYYSYFLIHCKALMYEIRQVHLWTQMHTNKDEVTLNVHICLCSKLV